MAALIALLGAAPAGAAPIDVGVRLEGGSETFFDHTIEVEVRTVRSPSDSQERTCDGTSGGAATPAPTPVTAMVDAVDLIGETWDGNWSNQFQNYFVTRIVSDTQNGNQFWGVLLNDAYTVPPTCAVSLVEGDDFLWAYDVFGQGPRGDAFLRLNGPATATVGEQVEFTTSTFNPNSGADEGAYEGAQVDAVDALGAPFADDPVDGDASDAAGAATVTFTEPGWQRLKARDARDGGGSDEAVASNSVDVCVEAQAGDGCAGAPLSERSLETPVNSTDPSIAGTPREDQTLIADEGVWSPEPQRYLYEWRRCSAAGDDCSAINGAEEREYVATASDVGSTLRVEVTAVGGLDSASELSDNSAVVEAAAAAPTNVAPPELRGRARVGDLLTAFEGEWTGEPDAYSYEWLRCDAQGSTCQTIPGVDEDEYEPTEADEGSTIRVVVVASNEVGDSAPARSAPSSEVVGAPVREELRVKLAKISSAAGRRVEIRVRSSESGVVTLESKRLGPAEPQGVRRGVDTVTGRLTAAAAKRLRKRGRLPVRVNAELDAGDRFTRDSEVLLLRR